MRGMKEGRREITAQVFRSHAEHEAANAVSWKQLTPDERLALVWQLTEEQWRLKGDFPDEPRIQRTIVRVVRGPATSEPRRLRSGCFPGIPACLRARLVPRGSD